MKTRPIFIAGLAALFVSHLSAQTIVNGTFTVNGTGSFSGWTLVDNSPDRSDSPFVAWNPTLGDRASLMSGDGIYQTFGGGYLAAAEEQITVTFDARRGWSSPVLAVSLFSDGDIVNVLATQSFSPTNEMTSYSISYTVVGAAVGKSVGVAFFVAGAASDDRWAEVDNVTVSVQAVPEPASFAMLAGVGALAGAFMRRRRRS